jgi:hypothetical protein
MQITVSTVINAPIQQVWSAYTTPEDIKLWNAASSDWHTTSASVDLRPGGKFCSRMEAKDGSFGFDFEGEYTKVAYFSDRGRLFQADRGRQNGVAEAALGKRTGTGLTLAQSSTISLKRAAVGRVPACF